MKSIILHLGKKNTFTLLILKSILFYEGLYNNFGRLYTFFLNRVINNTSHHFGYLLYNIAYKINFKEFLLEEMKYFIFSFPCTGDEAIIISRACFALSPAHSSKTVRDNIFFVRSRCLSICKTLSRQ